MRARSLLLLLSGCALALLWPGCQAPAEKPVPAPRAPGIVSAHGALRVVAGRIVGVDDQPVSVAGPSFFWSQWQGRFYNPEVVAWMKADWHAGIVRAALGVHEEDGYLQHPAENYARVTRVIDAAIAEDLYVLVDWHDHHANQHTAQAIEFFQKIARRYGQHPHVIYEIFNEPTQVSWAKDVKPYAEAVVAAIRAIDPDNLIVVGSPHWAQDVDIAAADPIQDANVAYSLHFYAGTHKQKLRDKAEKALLRGAALFVTEWGTCNADGNGPIDDQSVQEWLAFMRQHQLSHCNWAVSDKRETASMVQPDASSRGGWTDADLTPSGRYVRALVRGWAAPAP